MHTHIRVIGWLQIVLGVLDLLLALAVFGLFAGVGVIAGLSGDVTLPLIGGTLGTVLGAFLALTGLPNLLAGAGLLAGKGWGRILALVLAIINLFKFPWGTALAAYTFWALTGEEARRYFADGRPRP